MSEIIPNVVISMPSQQFTLPRRFQAMSNGKIYIGKIDTDPTIPSNQIQVYLENEDGSTIPVAQPLIINQAGFPVYNGQIAKLVTVEGHSMAVCDSYGTRQFYYPNVLKYDPDQFDKRVRHGDGSLLGLSYNDSEINFDANSFAQLTVFADLFIEKSQRVIDGIHAACDYVASKGGGFVYLSPKTYLLEDELVPRDKVKVIGNSSGQWGGLTTLKWAGGSGVNKSVVRASKDPLGAVTDNNLSLSGVINCYIDAEGCDVGFYSQYATNGCDFSGLTTRNATKANAYILKSWFCDYDNLVSVFAKDKGVVIGHPLFGETGQMNVNACGFTTIKAHSSGVNMIAGATDKEAGSGVILGKYMTGNYFRSVQCENNGGIGLLAFSTFTNAIGSIYIEKNGAKLSDEYKNCGLMYESGGSYAALSIASIHLAANQYIINNVDLGLVIQTVGRNDDVNSFRGTGRVLLASSNLRQFTTTDFSKIASDNVELVSGKRLNTRYTTSFDNMSFLLSEDVGYPHVVIVPRASYTFDTDLTLRFDSQSTSTGFGKTFVSGEPVIRRYPSLTKGFQQLKITQPTGSTDAFFDIYVMYARERMGGQVLPRLSV